MNYKLPIVFDTDCLSSFLWINRLDIIEDLFTKDKIVIPEIVVDELSKLKSGKYKYVYTNLKEKLDNKEYIQYKIKVSSDEAVEYINLTKMDNPKAIGKGEAAAIVISKSLGGTLASNNLKDILPHVKGGKPPYITTEMILYKYYEKGKINIDEGEQIWKDMKNKRRKLPNYNFQGVINKFQNK